MTEELLETCTHLTVECWPRYWEDTTVNGEVDTEGKLIPFRNGDLWNPVIELATGKIINWPQGMTASIHYKVCDQGRYYLGTLGGSPKLLGAPKLFQYGAEERRAKQSTYVPDDFLCHGDLGYGDYIIMNVSSDGQIAKYRRPTPDRDEWTFLP